MKSEYIADQFGLSADDFERYRYLGLVVVSVERHFNEQMGMCHVKCRLGNRVWEALVDEGGTVVYEATRFLRGKLARLNRDR
ncbi:hypothetical protein ABIA14_006619 [Sinorhizobium fredii]|nr:hypothetical protein AOX55_00006543 [Sinorhizobium fredii CCBAU 25509]